MSSAFNRWLLILLVGILPLQAVAASIRVCCALASTVVDDDGCGHDRAAGLTAADVRATVLKQSAHGSASAPDRESIAAAGGHGLCCLAAAPAPSSGALESPKTVSTAGSGTVASKTSFFSDAPERPPRLMG